MATRFVTTKIALEGEKEYKDSVKRINDTLSELRSEEKLLSEQFKGQANSLEALRAEQKNLSAQYTEVTQKIDLAKAQLDKYNAGLDECRDAMDAARSAIESSGSSVEALQHSTSDLSDEQERLLKDYLQAESSMKKMESGVHSMTLQYNNARAEQLKLSSSMEEYSRYVAEAETSTDGLASSIDEYGKKVGDANEETSLFGEILGGNLLSDAISKGVSAVIGLFQEAIDKGTEYSRSMATLTAAGESAGYTASQTEEAYGRMYTVIGDEESSMTAVNYLQRLGLEQNELLKITDMLSGAYIKFNGDLNLPGLAEAMVQLKNTGEVTGELQKVLEQSGIDVNEFKDGIALTADGMQRLNSFLTVLSYQTAGVTESFRNANPEIIEMNETQLRLNQAMADFAEQAAPVLTFLTELATALLWCANQAWELISSLFQLDNTKASPEVSLTDVSTDTHNRNRRRGSRDGSHASGLAYVPFDGYLAELHEGERVLTAQQNAELSAYRASAAFLSVPSTPAPSPAAVQSAARRENVTIDVTLELDGQTLARKQYPLMQAEGRRRGTPLAGKEGT